MDAVCKLHPRRENKMDKKYLTADTAPWLPFHVQEWDNRETEPNWQKGSSRVQYFNPKAQKRRVSCCKSSLYRRLDSPFRLLVVSALIQILKIENDDSS
jgi:hypothetical protein